VLAVVWGGATAGIVLQLAWTGAPRWLGGVVYLALGWVAVAAMPQLFARLGVAGGLLLVAGGLVYSAGAGVYALRRPDPVPAVFGYHEVFHLLVIAGGCRPFPGHQPVRATHRLTHPTGGPCGRGGLPRVLCQRGAVQLRRR
jgi:channel protein (hemolysin III family)